MRVLSGRTKKCPPLRIVERREGSLLGLYSKGLGSIQGRPRSELGEV